MNGAAFDRSVAISRSDDVTYGTLIRASVVCQCQTAIPPEVLADSTSATANEALVLVHDRVRRELRRDLLRADVLAELMARWAPVHAEWWRRQSAWRDSDGRMDPASEFDVTLRSLYVEATG